MIAETKCVTLRDSENTDLFMKNTKGYNLAKWGIVWPRPKYTPGYKIAQAGLYPGDYFGLGQTTRGYYLA